MSTELSPVLSRFVRQRKVFDPSNDKDLKEFGYFLKHNKWKNGCPFIIEWPYSDIVSMCQAKYTIYKLK